MLNNTDVQIFVYLSKTMHSFCQTLLSNQSSHYKQNPLFCKQVYNAIKEKLFIRI